MEADVTVEAVLAALLDPRRLAVAGALVDTRRTIDDVVEHTGLDRPEMLQAVGRCVKPAWSNNMATPTPCSPPCCERRHAGGRVP